MNEQEAHELLEAEIARLRTRPYRDFFSLIDKQEDYWVTGPSGTRYGVEVDVFWDRKPRDGDIRVIAMIDDGGPSAQRPMSSDFIIAVDGSFVGE